MKKIGEGKQVEEWEEGGDEEDEKRVTAKSIEILLLTEESSIVSNLLPQTLSLQTNSLIVTFCCSASLLGSIPLPHLLRSVTSLQEQINPL